MKPTSCKLTFSTISLQLSCLPAQGAEEQPAEIIAAQIRDQGYACAKALSAEREHPESGDAVWILKCENATYRVRLFQTWLPKLSASTELCRIAGDFYTCDGATVSSSSTRSL